MEINERRQIPLGSCTVQVNGDDCVMSDPTPDHGLLPIWEASARYFGLSKSEGKTFFSPDFILINTRRYLLTEHGFKLIPFVNFALAHAKAKDGTQTKRLWEFQGLTAKMKTLCPEEIYRRAFLEFVDTNVQKLEKADIYWYFPMWLGGLGIDPPHDYWISRQGRFARQVAFLLRSEYMKKIQSFPMDAASLLWQKANKDIYGSHSFGSTGELLSKDVTRAATRNLINRTLLSGEVVIDYDSCRDVAHGTLDGLKPKTDPNKEFVNKCWKVIRANSVLHVKASQTVHDHPTMPRISIADLVADVPKTYSKDLFDSDFPRSEVLINIKNQLANYFTLD